MIAPQYLEKREKEALALKESFEALPLGRYVIEFGCGHGHFLTALAQCEKEETYQYIGIDKKRDRLLKAKKKSDRAKVDIHWIKTGVEQFLDQWPVNRPIAKSYVLFPDPWPKKRHWKHRFVNETFLRRLSVLTQEKGLLYFRTDHKGYFAWVMDLLKSSKEWKVDTKAQWPQETPETVFEGHHPIFESVILQKVTSQYKTD